MNLNDFLKEMEGKIFVGNGRYVFNIKGNTYRLVVLVIFVNGTMQVKFCGTHAEYDKIKNIENL